MDDFRWFASSQQEEGVCQTDPNFLHSQSSAVELIAMETLDALLCIVPRLELHDRAALRTTIALLEQLHETHLKQHTSKLVNQAKCRAPTFSLHFIFALPLFTLPPMISQRCRPLHICLSTKSSAQAIWSHKQYSR
ncbi:hypothetical protein WR25_20772 [Diploscapter pachys]|uniref:Uncharacterized protein n=1 Tax=Diploscapter pachys TaxID=2018661 RepID=A0A2A2KE31_9BILA|nr:hypothetical protein WR25_20772 [Diploscapter pachys]